MSYDAVPTICVSVVAVFAINAVLVAHIVKWALTGSGIVQRRTHDEDGKVLRYEAHR